MKILQANNNYFIKGGSDTVFFFESKLLQSAGHQVIPYCPYDPRNIETPYSDYFPRSAYTEKPSLKDALRFIHNSSASLKLSRLIDNYPNIDVAHLHIYYGKLTASILPILKQNNIPIIQSLHDFKLICPVYSMERLGRPCEICVDRSKFNVLLYRCKNNSYLHSLAMLTEFWISRLQGDIRYVDQFICVSNFQRNVLERGGIPIEKLNVLYNFVNTDKIVPVPNEEKEDYLLYFGRIEKTKGIKTLINAVKKTGHKLIIVGAGSWDQELIKGIDGSDFIEFKGFQKGKKLRNLVAKARAAIIPSECPDICPMSLLEAKSAGTPVIGSEIGGIPELINDGKDGFLFEAGNENSLIEGLEKLDNSKIKSLSEEARRDVLERFSANIHLQKLLEIYRKVKACY